MRFTLGEMSLDEYQRYLEISNYKCIFRHPQFLRVWVDSIPGTSLRFLIGDSVVIPGVIFKRGPLKAFYSLPYQTFGGPVGRFKNDLQVEFDFSNFSEVAIDDPERKMTIPHLYPIESYEAVLDISDGYDRVFSRYSPSRRNLVRRLKRDPPEIKPVENEKDIEIFYQMYRTFSRSKNIHVFSLKFFKNLLNYLPENTVQIFIVSRDGPVGYVLNLKSYNKVYGLLLGWREKDISTFLVDLSIKKAIERGSKEFSLGLTSPRMKGVLEFKKSFGVNFKPVRTYWKRTFYHNLARDLKTGIKKWLRF